MEKKFKPTICADVRYLPLKLGVKPNVMVMSPPCQRFSLANPKFPLRGIKLACEVMGACLEAVAIYQPNFWLMENPRGRMRWLIGTPKQTIRYSDYDFGYPLQKATDLWGNIFLPMAKGMRRPKTYGKNLLGVRKLFPTVVSRSVIPFEVSAAVKTAVEAVKV